MVAAGVVPVADIVPVFAASTYRCSRGTTTVYYSSTAQYVASATGIQLLGIPRRVLYTVYKDARVLIYWRGGGTTGELLAANSCHCYRLDSVTHAVFFNMTICT